jgi:hypothetical protein
VARSGRSRERACSVLLSPDECPAASPSADLRGADSPGMPSGVMGDSHAGRLGETTARSIDLGIGRSSRRLPWGRGSGCPRATCQTPGTRWAAVFQFNRRMSPREACRGGEPVRLSSSDGPAQPFRRPAAGLFEMPTPRLEVARAGGVGDQVPGGRSSVTPRRSSPASQTMTEFQPPVIHERV